MRYFTMRCVIIVLGLVVLARAPGVAKGRSPNIVIFLADDMGFGDAGCNGCTDIKTPNIDALAAGGIRFTNYYSAAPICSPSRAGMLTGRYPIRAGVPGNCSSMPGDACMPADEVTVAELAKTRGYATAVVGKWHLGFSQETVPNAQGFDFFFGHHAGCIDYYSHMFYWQDPPHHDLYRNREEVYEEGTYMTDLIVREATRFIDENKDRPFLIYVAFNAPHYPTQAPERFRKMYAHLPSPRSLYAPLVAGLDEAIGTIMGRVRQAGLERDTLVFFASDNGASVEARNNYGGGSDEPYRGYKFSLFEGGIHMPAIVSRPGTVPAGETRGQVVVGMDVFATIAEAIGAELPAGRKIDGQSWMPLLKDRNAPGHDTLFWAQGEQKAVRRGKWKLVVNGVDERPGRPSEPRAAGRRRGAAARAAETNRAAGEAVFLADLEADPSETKNLREERPEIVVELTKMHEEWQAALK